MRASSELCIENLLHTFKTFHSIKDDLDDDFYDGLAEIAMKAIKDVTEHTGMFLHKLKDKAPEEETLTKIITAVPASLSCVTSCVRGCLPLYGAPSRYIPLLAQEGVKYNVGGDGARGGLLVGPVGGERVILNTLQLVAFSYDDGCLKAIQSLRKLGLLRKQDIDQQHLLLTATGVE